MTDSGAEPTGADVEMSPIRVVSRNATAVDIAAVTAVVTAALEELSSEPSAEPAEVSAWRRSQRGLRSPIHPGPGAWRQS
ncbi:hypothetical protein HDC94_002727 [Leifsonia sp. AK011]|uniref:acyl-CoA carboxylase subunit epsilon n=1 Tax=Leifsonia sp. AK011 TaxID=2723075 RepID=UPI0018576C88|nr:acyl-CoA carboxylase subunit epsilon [Leifsonia sp. AK011]NYF11571.1 hypothetical protein [Leifsonia sp. AK011]